MAPRGGKECVSGGNTTLFKLKNGKYIRRKNITGGNTTPLFKLKKGKYVRRENVAGGGIFGTILKHVNRHKSKFLKMGSSVGKKVLKEAKTQLKKPENQKLLRNVTDHLIEKVTDKIDQASSPAIKKKYKARENLRKGTSTSGSLLSRSHGRARSGLRGDLLALTKKEAKKIARKKSRQLVNNFTRYIE